MQRAPSRKGSSDRSTMLPSARCSATVLGVANRLEASPRMADVMVSSSPASGIGLVSGRVDHNVGQANCCRQQQSSARSLRALWSRSRRCQLTTTAAPTSLRRRAGNGTTRRNEADEIGLDALVGHAGYAVRRFQIWIFQDFIKTLGEVDIRPTQYSVLTVIGANPGLSQMAVAKRLGIERARLVHLLDSLEARDLVDRIPSAIDRRSHALHLTASGKAALA